MRGVEVERKDGVVFVRASAKTIYYRNLALISLIRSKPQRRLPAYLVLAVRKRLIHWDLQEGIEIMKKLVSSLFAGALLVHALNKVGRR